jgi:sialic acid synthase SpsE
MTQIKVITEPAIYWHGDTDLLKETIVQAAASQADFFKVQLFDTERMGNPWQHKKRFYRQCEIGKTSLTLNEIREMCDNLGLVTVATVNHAHKVDLCKESNVNNIKIASGQIHPLLINAIKEHQWERVFVSTGMVETIEQLKSAEELCSCAKEIIFMHCVSLYPTHDAELNLRRVAELYDFFLPCKDFITVGYSDHHMDDLPCLVAVGLGATYLEKHFRLEHSFGPTAEIAVLPHELANLTALCKRMGRMMGDGRLTMQEREKESFERYKTRWVI